MNQGGLFAARRVGVALVEAWRWEHFLIPVVSRGGKEPFPHFNKNVIQLFR